MRRRMKIGKNSRYSRGDVSEFIYLFIFSSSSWVASKPEHLPLWGRQNRLKKLKLKEKECILSKTVSILSRLFTNLFHQGTNCVLFSTAELLKKIKKEKRKSVCLSVAPKSGWPKPLGPRSRPLRGEKKSDKRLIVGRGYEAAVTETVCVVVQTDTWCETAGEQKSDSPPRCVRKNLPVTSGGQTLSRSYWFLCKQARL